MEVQTFLWYALFLVKIFIRIFLSYSSLNSRLDYSTCRDLYAWNIYSTFHKLFFTVTMWWDYVFVELWLLTVTMSISQMVHEWIWCTGGMILTGKMKWLREKPVPVPLCPPQIPHGLPWEWTWAPQWVINYLKGTAVSFSFQTPIVLRIQGLLRKD
jgi:hypothetical protein